MENTLEVTKAMRDDLRKPLPAEAVKPHPTKTYLSSIKAIYVTERISDVFGLGCWQIRVEKESEADGGMVVVKVIFSVPKYGVYYECYGGNDNGGETSKNFDLGDAYKGATTDAITKIGSWLEVGIDVFKGKNTPAGGNGSGAGASPEKWFNKFLDKEKTKLTPEWEGAIRKLKAGTTTVATIAAAFKLSKELRAELEAVKPDAK